MSNKDIVRAIDNTEKMGQGWEQANYYLNKFAEQLVTLTRPARDAENG